MVQDVDDDDDVFSDSSSLADDPGATKPLSRLQIDQLLRMVLQDAQTRLVFRAQALVQAEVSYYVAKPDDLDYPSKIASCKCRAQRDQRLISVASTPGPLVARTMSVSLDVEDDDEPTLLSLPTTASQDTWYPTLRTTLWLLSCLHNFVDVGPDQAGMC